MLPAAQKRAQAREATQTHTLESDEEDAGEDEQKTKAAYSLTDEDLHENLDSEVRGRLATFCWVWKVALAFVQR